METIDITPFDTIAVPPKVVRRFENISADTGYLLALVCGGAEGITEVEYTPDVGAKVVDQGGADVRAMLEAAGVGFTAGER